MGPSPKKAKEPSADPGTAWRTCIEKGVLDDKKWTVKVIMIEAAGGEQDCSYLNKFEIFAVQEKRFVIKNICKTETIFMINQLGVEKKTRDENFRIFEEGQSYLKEKKDIPSDIIALTIKHLILKMKDEYLFIKRHRLEVQEGLRRESTTMIGKEEIRGAVSEMKPPEPPPPPPPPPPKGKKGKGAGDIEDKPEPTEGKKYNTVLRERGEEWRDKVYIDDFPTDGPDLYVAVTGFQDPYLPGALIKIGVPLAAIVQIRIDPTVAQVPSSLVRSTKRGQSAINLVAEKSLQFWADLQKLRIQQDTADDFKNTAFIIFSPPYGSRQTLTGEADDIYDELCFLMYDVQDLVRQHANFLNNVDIIEIPEEQLDGRYFSQYHVKIDDLPLECVTIYSLLDSMLQVASKNRIDEKSSSRTSLSTALTLNQRPSHKLDTKTLKAEDFIKDVFDTLCKTETNKKTYRITYGEEYETHKDPIIIQYGDFSKYPTFHLGNIDLENIVGSTLYGMPLNQLWLNLKRPEGEHEAKINFHVNVLLSCFERDDVETAELERLMHILACRKLFNNRSSLKKQHLESNTITDFKKSYLKRSILAEPLPKCPSLQQFNNCLQSSPSLTKSEDDFIISQHEEKDPETSRIKCLFDCPDISELVSAAEIANNQPVSHIIDDYDFFEDFSGITAFQIVHNAFSKFNCVDYKYCEVTDCLLLMFYNNHDKDHISREEWRCHIQTPLCLEDFFDFVLDEHYDWIIDQERIYEENMLFSKQSEYQDIVDPFAAASCVNDKDVAKDLLMDGSLKYHDIHDRENEESPYLSPAKSSVSRATSAQSTTDKSSKKTKSPVIPKNRQSVSSERVSVSMELGKPFTGYNLGDRRVEALGKYTTFFSKDGTRVTSNYYLLIPDNLEYIILNVVPGGGDNEFWIHRALGEFIPPHIHENCHSFRVTTKDQVMINIKRQSYAAPISIVEEIKANPRSKSSKLLTEEFEPVQYETKYFHSFYVTWPNGHITESIHDINSPQVAHIKQYHLSPVPQLDEEMRCITLNGEVVIFKFNGDVEVLRPDGSYILITNYEKNIVVSEEEQIPSEVNSDKGKKNRSKEKVRDKEKLKKSTSKIVKGDKNAMETKQIAYEIIIKEFQIIETSGLRQKWIQDDSFDIEKLLIRTATDYYLGEIFSRRMDGTNTLLNKDGIHSVTFPNKTRIITYFVIRAEEVFPEWTEEEKELFAIVESDVDNNTVKSKGSTSQKSMFGESVVSTGSKKVEEEEIKVKASEGYLFVDLIYTIEHANFSTITIDKTNMKISVDSPNNTTISVDIDNNYELTLDEATTATFNGEKLNISYEACPKCKSHTKCNIVFYQDDENTEKIPIVPPANKNRTANTDQVNTIDPTKWLIMKDSFSKKVFVDLDGNINLLEESLPDETLVLGDEITVNKETDDTIHVDASAEASEDQIKTDAKSETSVLSHGKCRESYQAKNIRFFIMRRDLRVSELLHRALLDQYKHACQWQPWCNIAQYDTFGDHRMLHSVLKPIYLTESEKWLMESKLSDKPKYLTYKDLKKDTGKGFYHWMRPYDRFVPHPAKPENVLPPRLPRAFILRVLEEQWGGKVREELKGARELLQAILKYRHIMESDSETLLHIPVIDTRDEEERRIDRTIQAIANRLYYNLRAQQDEEVQKRARPDITTKPPQPVDEPILGEMEEDPVEILEEERRSVLQELEEAESMSPELKRYWRRRAEEKKEEKFYWCLLRESSFPPYFHNMLGGAIWWEVNAVTDEAITKAQRRKMKCICSEEGTSKTGNNSINTGVFDVLDIV